MNYDAVMKETNTLPALTLVPPKSADVEGVFRQKGSPFDNRVIYTEVVPDIPATKAAKTIKRDPITGEEMWKKNGQGEPLYPIHVVKLHWKTIRYVLKEVAGRHVKRVQNFEMSEAEKAHEAAKDAERNFLRDFVREAAKANLSPGELVARLKADIVGDEPGVEIDVTEEVIAREMAAAGEDIPDDDVIDRPDDEEGVGALSADDMPEPTTPKPRRRRKQT